MKSRRMSRINALQTLYGLEMMAVFNQGLLEDEVARQLKHFESDPDSDGHEFTVSLVLDTYKNLTALDQEIEMKSSNWKVARMGSIDRNILRMALTEIKGGTPPAVVINEAVELAKAFGDVDSASFVNGVLDSFVKTGGK